MFIVLLVLGLLGAGVATVFDRFGDEEVEAAGSTSSRVTRPTSSLLATTLPAGASTTVTSQPATSTTSGPTTSTTRATTTTASPPTTTPATTAPATTLATYPECAQNQYTISVGTAKRSYVLGEPVVATVVVTDVSPEPCYLPDANVVWLDATGVTVSGASIIADCFGRCPPNLFPGQVRRTTACWDQRSNAGSQVALGRYSAFSRGATSPTFEIVPGTLPSPPPTC